MKGKTRLAVALTVGLVLSLMTLGAVASQGSESNPLVTLSYLNEVFLPKVMAQVEEKVAARETQALSGGKGQTFEEVTLAAGETVTLNQGGQVVVRGGTVTTSHAFTDLTAGGTSSSMEANHLYMASGQGMTVTATADATLMIQGGWKK